MSRQAVKRGVSFRNIGNSFIKKYKENKLIDHVCLIFVTGDRALCKELAETAKKTDAITLTLNHIMDGLSTDCSTCSFKAVCDEVEGPQGAPLQKRRKADERIVKYPGRRPGPSASALNASLRVG